MTVWNVLRYGLLLLRYPWAHRFINEGFGIDARYHRSQRFWQPHLSLTRSFIVQSLSALRPTSLTVLGSGRLYDFPEPSELPDSISSVRLCDGNPMHVGHYRLLTERYLQHGIALRWQFGDLLKTPDASLQDEVVISLNLISQLSLMCPSEPTPAALHLEQLGRIAKRAAIIIGDQSWFSYTPNSSHWEEEVACPDIAQWRMTGLSEVRHDQWLWHVAPYGIERADCGVIHDVHARLFRRGDPNAKEFS